MRQCTLVGNVEARANLIGGKKGLVLELCHTLIVEKGLKKAEDFLLSYADFVVGSEKQTKDSEPFSIQPCHSRILWLIEEHVLYTCRQCRSRG
jgi:hypothetical protein